MCGICGKLVLRNDCCVEDHALHHMMDVMRHRGPDDEGVYISGRIGLGHRRLSIIDLDTGKQPICNEDGTVWIVLNGEIYNYQELRNDLVQKRHKFATKTDTEVIVHLYEEYGEGCLSKLRGMFAFALWDERKQVLLLARDRVGIKPLYYFVSSEQIVFASEIKAILKDDAVPRSVNLQMIDRFLSYYYMPGDETMFVGIRKLAPAHYLIARKGKIEVKPYWNLRFNSNVSNRSFSAVREELLGVLREAVKIHMISDVPVGFLLSGGVDSTAMLCLGAEETDREISTFTLGFSGGEVVDERKYARLAAERYGTRHYDLTISAKEFADFLPDYVYHMEEPVCEPPAVALYYVSRLASEHVKVLISGEGGDEAFAGYQTYRNLVWLERIKSMAGPLNGALFRILGGLKSIAGLGRLEKYVPLLSLPLGEYYFSRTSTPFTLFNSQYRQVYTEEFGEAVDKVVSTEPSRSCLFNGDWEESTDYLAKMLYTDTKTWLPDDLLIKADKMTMANSVELRVPLLDHEVLEFAASLPSSFKLRGITTKYILKKAFAKIVPEEILKRKKTGFPVPYGTWLRNELRPLTEDVLLSQRATSRGYFRREKIERMLGANLGHGQYAKEIFSLLVLELWHRTFVDP